jgi:WD40 repeat protein
LKTLPAHKGAVTCLAVSADGKTLASGGTDKHVKLWRLDEEKSDLAERLTLSGHTETVRCLAFSPDGKWLASGGDDQSVWMWDPETGTRKQEPRRDHAGPVTALSIFSSPKTLTYFASGSTDRTVSIWTSKEKRTWRGLAGEPRALAFSPDGGTLAVAGSDRCITLWDADLNEPRLALTGHTQPVSSLAFAPDGRLLISGGHDGDVRLWRAAPVRKD